jgi:hypothetical protein
MNKIDPSDCPILSDEATLQFIKLLNSYDYVAINRGDDDDRWNVCLVENTRQVRKSSPWLCKALWAATTEIDQLTEQDYTEYVNKRKAALAKLNAEERKILNIP